MGILFMDDGLDRRIRKARAELQALLAADAQNHPAWKHAVQRKADRLGRLRRERDRYPRRSSS